jgi:hydroxymethylpyrimidine pyrophosphatase-like HAD family hydrolase
MANSSVSPYRLFAADYDGTLAHHGLVDETTVTALERLKAAGVTLVMVTGRRVPSLLATFPRTDLFDVIVAENGAVIYHPVTAEVRALADPPPPALVEGLKAAEVPAALGYSIVETIEPHHHVILDLIRQAGLEWHIIFNKGSVMVLPAGVNKCTGLAHVLKELGVDPGVTVGIGDAENDHAFLSYCGLSVAVANALPSLRAEAHLVTTGRCGAGVAEVIEAWLTGRLERPGLATLNT